MRSSEKTLVGLFLFLIFCSHVSVTNASSDWLGNDIGKDEIVLPGFDPIKVSDSEIMLGSGRKFSLSNGFIFGRIESKKTPLMLGDTLTVEVDGVLHELKSDSYVIKEKTPHHVEIELTSSIEGKLKVNSFVRIEYDGLVMISMELQPLKSIELSKVFYEVSISSNEWSKVLMFKPETTHVRQKKTVFDAGYKGEFLNAISIVDGNRSFWWFADNAEGWQGDVNDVTEIHQHSKYIKLKQKIINRKIVLNNKKTIDFNLMVTPVKNNVGNVRQNRHARRPSEKASQYQGVNVWWTSAFSHQILPYTEYPVGVKSKLPIKDLIAYPGLDKNRAIIAKYKNKAIDKLPYFSGHMLSQFDVNYQENLAKWEVHPKKVWSKRKYDRPFTAIRNEAYLTHRGEGYTDYLIYRFSKLVDEIGFEGLYFDQGGVLGSSNPLNGRWYDDENKVRSSTDILALRAFHKRLATMLHLKGKKGLIFSHNSNTAILPAYSFVTAMVQGEEYIHWLKSYDYIDSVNLDEIRTRIGSSSFGVTTMWLEVLYAKEHRLDKSSRPYRMNKKEWLSSEYYVEAYNNFMALALLHDMPTWAFAPLRVKNNILSRVDWIDPVNSKFVGYWSFPRKTFMNEIYFSYYVSTDNEILLIISNLSNSSNKINLKNIMSYVSSNEGKCNDWDIRDQYQLNNNIVEEKTFSLVQIECN